MELKASMCSGSFTSPYDSATIRMVIKAPGTPPEAKCPQHKRIAHIKVAEEQEGSESFCICKDKYVGSECEFKMPTTKSNKLLENILEELDLRVPGMYDLMESIENVAETVTVEHNKTRALINQSVADIKNKIDVQ